MYSNWGHYEKESVVSVFDRTFNDLVISKCNDMCVIISV